MLVLGGSVLLTACNDNKIGEGDTGLTDDPGDPGDTDDPDDTEDPDDTGDTEEPEPVDKDKDGYTDDVDCDDSDPDVNPGADEVDDDGIDNDCDGWVDETMVCDDDVAEYGTIQGAIDDAADGDVIQVCPGLYPENLLINGTQLVIEAIEGPSVTFIDGSDFSSTVAVANVGASGTTIIGFTIQNGQGYDGNGGGVYCASSTLELVDNVITDNEATNAGGGLVASGCTLTLSGNTISDNTAPTAGGGVYIANSTGDISGNLFSGNLSNNGGGLYIQGNGVTVDSNEFYDNYAAFYESETAFGGGLFTSGNGAVTNNDFIDNMSDDDGAGLYVYYASPDITGNMVQGNICGNDGAGVFTSVSSSYIADNVFSANEAYDDAGGLRIYYGSSLVENNDFYDNIANDDGGGMKASHSGSNEFRDLYFEGNVTGDAGGGFELDNETSPTYDCTFIDNTAYRGGGLHAWRNEDRAHEISDLYFEGNHAEDCGGGLQIDNDLNWVTVRNSTFVNNTADDGAAICGDTFEWDADDDDKPDTSWPSYIKLYAIVIVDNEAADKGGALYQAETTLLATNLTIHNNEGTNGAVVHIKENSAAVFSNNIITENGGSAAIVVDDGTASFSYCDLHDNWGGNVSGIDDPVGTDGNIDVSPGFTDEGAGDYTLSTTSDCVDAGSPAILDADGTRSDMGAYGGLHGADW